MKNGNLVNYSFLVVCLFILFMLLKNKLNVDTFLPKVDNFLPKVDNFLPKVDNFLPKVDNFLPGVFGFGPRIQGCTPENDCYPGSYATTQKYHNMCQPSFGLNRQKIGLHDHCTHDLGRMSSELYQTQNRLIPSRPPIKPKPRSMIPSGASPDQNTLVCTVDEHLQRRCKWIKPGTQSAHPPF
jgi:hypothetical protein